MWRLAMGSQHVLQHVLLFLTHRQPAQIEIIPELQSVGIDHLIVAENTYLSSPAPGCSD